MLNLFPPDAQLDGIQGMLVNLNFSLLSLLVFRTHVVSQSVRYVGIELLGQLKMISIRYEALTANLK